MLGTFFQTLGKKLAQSLVFGKCFPGFGNGAGTAVPAVCRALGTGHPTLRKGEDDD
jgi:hypothetical protein